MSTDIVKSQNGAEIMEQVLMAGDLAKMSPQQRTTYYMEVCGSLGLNPLTRPFEYISLNGKLTLYARKDCTDQLRGLRKVSILITGREILEDCYVVTARAKLPDGREDESTGVVNIGGLKGDVRANALMKAETKAKRRVTLSVCGLGLLDESEMETVPGAKPFAEEQPETPRTFAEELAAAFDAEAYTDDDQKAAVAAICGRYKVKSLEQLNPVQQKRSIEAIRNGSMREHLDKQQAAEPAAV